MRLPAARRPDRSSVAETNSDALRLTHLARFLVPALLTLFIVCEVVFYRRHHTGLVPTFDDALFATIGVSCINLFGAALIVLIIDPGTVLSRLLGNRFLRWLDTISYGFYVFTTSHTSPIRCSRPK